MDLDSILEALDAGDRDEHRDLPRGPAFFQSMDSPKARAERWSAIAKEGKKLTHGAGIVVPVPEEAHQDCSVEARQWLHPQSQSTSHEGRLRYAGSLTDDEARAAADGVVVDIWTKKSREKRAALLCEASPSIFGDWPRKKGHSAEQDADCCSNAKAREVWRRDHYVPWSQARWLNLGDFMEDRNKLLSVLHVRTAYSPNDWALFDTREGEGAWWTGTRPVWFNRHCVNFCGCNCGYGSLTDYSRGLTHSWVHLGFPRAFYTLEIQRDILIMLDEVVSRIIDDTEATGCRKWSALVQSGFGGSGRETLWNTYTEQAFASPAKFNPEGLLQRSKERLDMILDEIWLMQTEPAYMQRVIQMRKAESSFDNAVASEKKLTAVVTDLVSELCERLSLWKLVVAQLEEVTRSYKANTANDGIINEDQEEQLSRLDNLLKACLAAAQNSLESHLPAMQSMKDRFTAAQVDEGIVYLERNTDLDPRKDCDRLMWCINELKGILEERDDLWGMGRFFANVEREILAQGPAQYVDRRLFEQLADIQSLDELSSALSWSQASSLNPMINGKYPGPKEIQIFKSALKSKAKRKFHVNTTVRTNIYGAARALLDTPWPKGRLGLAWLEKSKACRQQLRHFWNVVREEVTKQDPDGEWSRRITESMMFDSDDQYLEEVEREEQTCLLEEAEARAAAAKADAEFQDDQPVTQTTWGNSTDENLPTGRKQTKAKAARTAASESASLDQDLQDLKIYHSPKSPPAEEPANSKIPVKKESLSIFRKMYPAHQDDLELRSNTRWQVFLQAMADAGFLATEASGSAVRFSNDQGSISFHKPHPDPVIDPVMLHSMARRMKKWFGWCSDRFVLRS